ncbi:hypothetical protein RJT34_01016 [Clitoria ternatea]|uniref:Uncharacterized protein n=1 Tax=Clitoria ternatea TaxID=43366 RepID=A0AAN9KGD8_CLITE
MGVCKSLTPCANEFERLGSCFPASALSSSSRRIDWIPKLLSLLITSAWTNMSFAIKHRDIEREWENRGGVVVIF